MGWLNLHAKTQEECYYFESMYTELMRKSDEVYDLLQKHTYVSPQELLRNMIMPFAELDEPTKYSDWIYV